MKTASTLTLLSTLLSTALAMPAFAYQAGADVTPSQVVTSLEKNGGVHPGQRRNHIKGTCAAGEFVADPAAAAG